MICRIWIDDISNERGKGLCYVVLGLEDDFGRYYDCVCVFFLWFKVLGFLELFIEG